VRKFDGGGAFQYGCAHVPLLLDLDPDRDLSTIGEGVPKLFLVQVVVRLDLGVIEHAANGAPLHSLGQVMQLVLQRVVGVGIEQGQSCQLGEVVLNPGDLRQGRPAEVLDRIDHAVDVRLIGPPLRT